MVIHGLVYPSEMNSSLSEDDKKSLKVEIMRRPIEYTLDSVMYLSGSDSDLIRTTAFSTLSALSNFSSMCPSVMSKI